MSGGTAAVVSFSGIDGAGKSTQINRLTERLRDLRLRVLQVTFWTDVATLTHFRERMSYRVFRGDRGIGRPGRPVKRRDKNVRAWYLTLIRCFFYLLDVVKLRLVISKIQNRRIDIVVFDRYIFDELANLPLELAPIRVFVRFLLFIAPEPDLALLLNAHPSEARQRKPEYPEDFLHANRASFFEMRKLANLTVIEASSIEAMSLRIADELARVLSQQAGGDPRHRWLSQRSLP